MYFNYYHYISLREFNVLTCTVYQVYIISNFRKPVFPLGGNLNADHHDVLASLFQQVCSAMSHVRSTASHLGLTGTRPVLSIVSKQYIQ